MWDRRTLNESNPRPVGVLAGHMDGITYIDSKGDSRYLLSNSKDQSIKLWDVRVFSSEDAQEFTRKVVSEQNWDYRWQKAPKKCTFIPRVLVTSITENKCKSFDYQYNVKVIFLLDIL